MAYLSIFCFNCSIRLGSIVAGIVSMLQALIPSSILWITGAENLQKYAIYLEKHMDEFSPEPQFEWLVQYLKKNSETFLLMSVVLTSVYILACCLEIYGAYKLRKWCLAPFIVLEAIRLIVMFAVHCIMMMVLKKKINLVLLIGGSVTGGFLLLLLGYFWACVVSLFQVISIINSDEYKMLYGDDPLAPIGKSNTNENLRIHKKKVENVKFYPSPDFTVKETPLKNETKSRNLAFPTANVAFLNASSRVADEYHLMRNNYLNRRSYGYY